MLECGLKATVNSDDPAYFGGYIGENYRAIQTALELSVDELVAVARNGFEATMLPQQERASALREFDETVANIRSR
jgi:adenosine deaminase